MQNKFETQLKIQNNTFFNNQLICWRKKEVNKRDRTKPSGHFNTKVFCFEILKNTKREMRKETKKKKRKRRHKTIGTRWKMEQEK